MSPEAKLARLATELAPFPDAQERLSFVVDRARRAPTLSPAERVDANRVRGCVSVVWLTGEIRDDTCTFRFAADSPVVRGLLGLLCDFYAGMSPATVAGCPLDPLESLGFLRDLSPTRRNGLASARERIREIARQAAG